MTPCCSPFCVPVIPVCLHGLAYPTSFLPHRAKIGKSYLYGARHNLCPRGQLDCQCVHEMHLLRGGFVSGTDTAGRLLSFLVLSLCLVS
jgi:hypothetical protein